MSELYDVVTNDGRRLNEKPISYRAAKLFSLDAMIASEEVAHVLPTSLPTVSESRLQVTPWLVVLVGVAAAAIVTIGIVAVIVAKGV